MSKFAADIAGFHVGVRKATQEVKLEALKEAARRLVAYTPVDTGYARRSWFATKRAGYGLTPNAASGSRRDKMTVGDRSPDGTASARRIARNLSRLGRREVDAIYLINNAPYIDLLEDGRTVQPGKGYMKKRVVAEWPAIVRAALQNAS